MRLANSVQVRFPACGILSFSLLKTVNETVLFAMVGAEISFVAGTAIVTNSFFNSIAKLLISGGLRQRLISSKRAQVSLGKNSPS